MRNYYLQSNYIFQKIKKAKNLLVNIHRSPDLDSVGSALALFYSLKQFGKKITIVSSSILSEKYRFFKEADKIKTINFSTFDFSPFDLFLILDSSSADMVTGSFEINLPKIPKIIIDHHKTNNLKGEIRLVDISASATSEIVFYLFKDWKIKIDQKISTALFAGIYSDTVFLKYPREPKKTFAVVKELIENGADQEGLVEAFYQNYSLPDLRLLGLFLEKLKLEKDFVWTAISFEEKQKFNGLSDAKELMTDHFLQSVLGIDLGILFFEEKKEVTRVSFRSKGKIDVSKLAKKFGGGGHRMAAGCTILGEFKKAVEEVIKLVKSYKVI